MLCYRAKQVNSGIHVKEGYRSTKYIYNIVMIMRHKLDRQVVGLTKVSDNMEKDGRRGRNKSRI